MGITEGREFYLVQMILTVRIKNRIGGYYRVFTLTEIETDTDTATETNNMQNCSHCTDTHTDMSIICRNPLQHTMA